MSVYLDQTPSSNDLLSYANVLSGNSTAGYDGENCIEIGIVNNMPDGALQSTERQLLKLLHSAADGLSVRVTFYALPEVPRADWGRAHTRTFYSPIEDLWNRNLDGMIVTGTEPRTSNLADEPYWRTFTRLLEWANENTLSSVWSCLAAHAAVLHLDGIGRRRLTEKRFGLFDCVRVSDHQLAAALPARTTMPHSRWNDLPEKDLANSGYTILTRSEHAGVDAFVRQRNSLFVFFQGHPEYEANTLLLEYRRDIGRYLRRERETYPGMPLGYFNSEMAKLFAAIQERALLERREDLLAEIPTSLVERTLAEPWHSVAVRMYGNWLTQLSALKQQSGRETQFALQAPATRRFAAGAD